MTSGAGQRARLASMERAFSAFSRDDEGVLVAHLDCGHRQHMRHKPPLIERPWVLTEEGRAGRIGMSVDCPLCDRGEMPEGFEEYKRTPIFDAGTVPAALLREHRTKLGVWGVLRVEGGALEYVVLAPARRVTPLQAGDAQVVVTAVPHLVVLEEGARFSVAFHRARATPPP